MAAIIGNIRGKVLLQIGDSEPIEVGTLLIPLEAAFEERAHRTVHLDISNGLGGTPIEVDVTARRWKRFGFHV